MPKFPTLFCALNGWENSWIVNSLSKHKEMKETYFSVALSLSLRPSNLLTKLCQVLSFNSVFVQILTLLSYIIDETDQSFHRSKYM